VSSRRDRRSWGRRALKRPTQGKTEQFLELYERGFSRSAIAAKLGVTADQVDPLFDAMEEDEVVVSEEKTATVGGGG
jgi:predicted ArsR family transcriptional regulator